MTLVTRKMAVVHAHRSTPSEPAIDDKPTIRYITKHGWNGDTRLAYTVQRPAKWNGQTVVALHGITRNLRFWNQHVDHWLRRGVQVVRVDLNNAGESLKANFSSSCKLSDDAQLVVDVVDTLGIRDKLFLVGHSRGGAVALLAANALEQRHKVSVAGVIAANSFVSCLAKHYSGRQAAYNSFGDDFEIRWGARAMLKTRPSSEAVPGLSDDAELRGSSAILASMVNEDIRGIANKVAAPVTVIASNNEFEPAKLMNDLCSGLYNPAPQQFLSEGVNHLFPTASPQRFLSIVDGVLSSKVRPKPVMRYC